MKAFLFFLAFLCTGLYGNGQNYELILKHKESGKVKTFSDRKFINVFTYDNARATGRLKILSDSSILIGNKVIQIRYIESVLEQKYRSMKTLGILFTGIGLFVTIVGAQIKVDESSFFYLLERTAKTLVLTAGVVEIAGGTVLMVVPPKYSRTKWDIYIHKN
jgi:hypothetical protein